MKILLLITVLVSSSFSQAIPKCYGAIDKLPAVHGIRLRMPVSELIELPVIEKPSRQSVGARSFESKKRVQIAGGKDRPLFSLRTYNDKVFSLIVYDESISANIDSYVVELTRSLRLPINGWYKNSNTHIISCQEFEITVNPTPNYFTLLDLPASKEVVRAPLFKEQKISNQ